MFSSVFGALAVSLEAGDAVLDSFEHPARPIRANEWSGTGCSGRWSVQPGGPTGAGGELMCQRRGKRCADPLCMQHCVEARSGTRKRLRGVRGVRGSWCGAMNGGRDGWGDSLASFPSRRRRRKNSTAARNAQWASHSSVYKTVGRGRADPGCQSYRLIPGNKGGINRRSKQWVSEGTALFGQKLRILRLC